MISIRKNHPLIKIVNNSLVDLPSPINISAWWNFGSLLGLCLITQIVTGLFLAIHYTADISLAFNRVAHISRDVNYGWLLRVIHANGASFFFYLFISSCWTRNILFILFFPLYMISRNFNFIYCNSNCFYRLCFNLRADIFLGSNCNYQSFVSNSILRTIISTMNLRGICCGQRNSNTIFYLSFSTSFYCSRAINSTFTILTPNWLKQPGRNKLKFG